MKLSALMLSLLLANALVQPAWADKQTEDVQSLMRSARLWDSKDKPEIARGFLQKLLLIQPDSQETLLMLGDLELRSGDTQSAALRLQTLEKIAPNGALTQEMRDLYRLGTSDKEALAKMRLLERAGQTAEAYKILQQIFPGKPPRGEASLDYYRILASEPNNATRAREGLSALYNNTGDLRYRLALLDVMSNSSESRLSAVHGYEDLSKTPGVNLQRLQESWRRSLYKLPDRIETITLIKHYLKVFPDDKGLSDQIATVQKNMLEQNRLDKEKAQEKLVQNQKAQAQEEEKKRKQSEEDYRIAHDPDTLSRTAALDALDQNKLDFAESTFQDLLKRHPKDPELLGSMGLVRLKQGKHSEAINWFTQAVHASKGGSKKWSGLIVTAEFWRLLRLADEQLDKKELAQAETNVNLALKLQKNDPDALALLGNIRAAAGQNQAAENLYRLALQIESDNSSAMRGLVSLLARNGNGAQALTLIQNFNQQHPDIANKYASLQASLLKDEADSYILAQRSSHAVQALEMAMLLTPEDPWLRFSLAKIYLALNLPTLAKQIMQDGANLAPQDPAMHYARALLLSSLEEYEAALASIANIPQTERTPAMLALQSRSLLNLRVQQAENQVAQGHKQEAARILSQAEELAKAQAPDNVAALEQVTEAWYGLGAQDKGLELMRTAPALPLASKVYFAGLLNRAKKDEELNDYLPQLSQEIEQQGGDAKTRFKQTIHDIEDAMASREFERLMAANKVEQAERLAKQVASSETAANPQFLQDRGRRLARVKTPAESIPLLKDIKADKPDDLDVRLDLANAYSDNQQVSEARQEMQDLLAMVTSQDIDTRLAIARLQIHMDDYAGAHQLLNDLQQRYPDNPDVWLQSGRLARAERKYNLAVSEYRKALVVPPPKVATTATASAPTTTGKPDLLLQNLIPVATQTISLSPAAAQEVAQREQNLRNYQSSYQLPLNTNTGAVAATDNATAEKARLEIAELDARKNPRLEVGLDSQFKNSSDGTSTYKATEIPLVAWFPLGYEAHGFLHLDRVNLNAGNLPSDFADAALFGQIQAAQYQLSQPLPQKANGTNIGLGYVGDNLRADIGEIGVGFLVHNLVGGLRVAGDIGKIDYSLELSRRPQTSSLLSYAGTRDPVSGNIWGGVTNNSLAGRLSTTLSNNTNVSASLSYGLLRGQNVLDNEKVYLRVAADRDLYHSDNGVLNLGVNFSYTHFAEDETYYTYGYGGYYSPQRSLSIGIPLEWDGRIGKLSYQLKTNLTYSRTNEKDMPFYPTDPVLQAAATSGPLFPRYYDQAIYAGGPGGGFGYGLRAAGEYRLTPYVVVGGRVEIDRSAYYAPSTGFMYLRYSFQPDNSEIKLTPDPVRVYSQF